jgi:hypothetical protein
VIGNAAYPGSGRLDNPVNDATAISQKLRSMGFTVTTVTDANRQRLVHFCGKPATMRVLSGTDSNLERGRTSAGNPNHPKAMRWPTVGCLYRCLRP